MAFSLSRAVVVSFVVVGVAYAFAMQPKSTTTAPAAGGKAQAGDNSSAEERNAMLLREYGPLLRLMIVNRGYICDHVKHVRNQLLTAGYVVRCDLYDFNVSANGGKWLVEAR